MTRDKAAAVSRAMSNVSSAIIFGAIYFRMSRKQVRAAAPGCLGGVANGYKTLCFASCTPLALVAG